MSRSLKLGLLLAIPVVLLLAMAFLPWWTNRFSFVVQQHLLNWSPYSYPTHYTGTMRFYDRALRLSYEEDLVDGQKHGHVRSYDDQGRLQNDEEWRQGTPWNGLCHFWEGKAWVARYHDGKVWDGAMREKSEWVYYVEGRSVSKEEYCAHHGQLPTADCALGLGFIKFH